MTLLNPIGNTLADLFFDFMLTPIMPPGPTHFNSATQKWSTIDSILVTPQLLPLFGDMNFLEQMQFGSDHFPLSVNMHLPTEETRNSLRWDWENADWDRYREELLQRLLEWIRTVDDVGLDELVDSLTEIIVQTGLKHVGQKLVVQKGKRRRKTFWNRTLSRLKTLLHSKRREWQRRRSRRAWQKYCDAQRKYKNELKRAKCIHWNNMVEKLNSGADDSFFKQYKKVANSVIKIPPLVVEGITTVSDEQAANAFTNAFKRGAIQPVIDSNTKDEVDEYCEESANCQLDPEYPWSPEKVWNIICALGSNKACGDDQLHNRLLKEGGFIVAVAANAVFEKCWSLGVFPGLWKLGILSPIPKTSKPSNDPTKYRPIALLSCLGKVYERLLHQRLRKIIEPYGLSTRQAGFRPGRNCEELLVDLTEDITASFAGRSATEAVFLDISKAYDSVWREGLVAKLIKKGVNSNLLSSLSSFLEDRFYVSRVNNTKGDWQEFDHGVPQGSVLSPTLFIIFVDDLAKELEPMDLIRIAFFADDIAIWTEPPPPGSDPDTHHQEALAQLQRALDTVAEWAESWRLKFNPDKCKYVQFTRCTQRRVPCANLKLGSVNLRHYPKARYLGVIFDRKLSFRDHIRHLKTKFHARTAMMYALIDRSVGLSPRRMLQLYCSCVRPSLEYGAIAWAPTILMNQSSLNELEKLQSKFENYHGRGAHHACSLLGSMDWNQAIEASFRRNCRQTRRKNSLPPK